MLSSQVKSLKELTSKIGSGATPRGGNSNYKASGISLIRSQNVLDFKFSFDGLAFIDETQAKALNNVEVFEHDILLNITGDSIARVCIVPNDVLPARVNQHVSIIRCKNKEDAEYVLCYLQFLKKHLLSICKVGGTRNALTKEAVEKINITLQPNHRILGKFISKINAKIELNNKINRELEAMAKTLYDYWFVQFDFPFDFPSTSSGQDVQGKPNLGGKPATADRPYKSSGGNMVYNAELKREIPEGWQVKKMREVLSIKNGRDHKHLELGTIPVYGSGGIMRYANSSLYNSESILIPRKGSLGNLFYINKPFWCVDTIFYTQMKFPHTCKYLFYTVQNLNISSMNTGTAVPSMTTEVLNNLSLIFPPLEMLKRFDEILSPIFKMKDYRINENQHLTALRDWLLPMLMNGQVTVRQAHGKAIQEAEERISSSTELSQSMAAEPIADYNRK